MVKNNMAKFRSQMFMVGDLVEANFNSTQQYGYGIVIAVDSSSMNPKVTVFWPNKNKPIDEYFQDIKRVCYE
jgi:hypothetical protein